jgi:cytochrome c553
LTIAPQVAERTICQDRYAHERQPFDRQRNRAQLLCTLAIVLIAAQGSALSLAEARSGSDDIRPIQVALAAVPYDQADPDIGAEINEVCAGCHGPYGEGGKEGEYPRLAGLPAEFIARQLLLFRSRDRTNLAMVEYVDHRQMPDEDIAHIAVYLADIDLPNRLPPLDPNTTEINAYQRLLDAERVVQIPRAPGDVDRGGRLYRRECASCHGQDGSADAKAGVPMLAGQYTDYLWRQIPKYIDKRRIHDPEDPAFELLAKFSEENLRDILAYVSTLDDW